MRGSDGAYDAWKRQLWADYPTAMKVTIGAGAVIWITGYTFFGWLGSSPYKDAAFAGEVALVAVIWLVGRAVTDWKKRRAAALGNRNGPG